MDVISPLSIKHGVASSIKLNASSPALSFTNLTLVFQLLDVRVVASAIAHVHIFESEPFIHFVVVLVIIHAPTTGLVVKHITFPSLSIITLIQHLLVLNFSNSLSIHFQ